MTTSCLHQIFNLTKIERQFEILKPSAKYLETLAKILHILT